MSYAKHPGAIGWIDLTVDDAEQVRVFYQEVVGWRASPVDMGGYADYNMIPPAPPPQEHQEPLPPADPGEAATPGGDAPVAGICHRRGPNAAIPAGWMIYVVVPDLEAAVARVAPNGGSVVARTSRVSAIVRDPAGNVFTLFQA